ncbi:MAG: hypothetical protein IV100_17815 [Myxococcales bacterium]|nr:hypothetical protein [Myxococcales bacterium]
MSDYTSVEAISGLLNEKRDAFMTGLTMSLGDELASFEVTVEPIANRVITQALPPSQYQEHTRGQDVVTEEVRKGYETTFQLFTFAYGVALTALARRTIKPEMFARFLQNMGMMSGQALAQVGVDVIYNDAWAENWSDGVPLVSNSHPSNVGLQDNLLASTLDHAGLAAAELMLLDELGPDGQKLGTRPVELMVPTALKHIGMQVVSPAVLVPSAGATSWAVPNPTSGLVPVKVMHTLTSATRSFLRGAGFRPQIIIADPSEPVVKSQPGTKNDIKIIDEWTILAGTHDWRGVIGIGA